MTENCTCGHDRDYHGNADGQTGWQSWCGSPDCDCENFAAHTPPPCLNCGCSWDSCLSDNEFCCATCAHFTPPTEVPF